MSNPHEDPGHRPPPPRQGEPHESGAAPYQGEPYQGGPAPRRDEPYQGGPAAHRGERASYQNEPDPHQGQRPPYPPGSYPGGPPPQPPYGQPWQGPAGYGPGNPHPAPNQRQLQGKGFLATLVDTNFDSMITVRLARTIYTIMIVMITLFALVVLWYGFSFFTWNSGLALMTIVAAPLIWLFDLLLVRVFMEFVINQFKITEHLKALRDREGLR